MNRSNEPKKGTVDHEHRVLPVVRPDIRKPKRAGIWASSWIVPSCHERPRTSVMWRSILGP